MKTKIEEVTTNLLYALDALDEYVHKKYQNDALLSLFSPLLLSYAANLDPEQAVPPPPKTLTLQEAIELIDKD